MGNQYTKTSDGKLKETYSMDRVCSKQELLMSEKSLVDMIERNQAELVAVRLKLQKCNELGIGETGVVDSSGINIV